MPRIPRLARSRPPRRSRSKRRINAAWKRISSDGIDRPEPLTSDSQQAYGNRLIALDLIRAIETDTQPKGSIYDGRAALEKLLMRSRWMADRRGRSDVKVSGGEVASELQAGGFRDSFVTGAQCWSDGFKTVFQAATPAALGIPPTQGMETDCAFTTAQLP